MPAFGPGALLFVLVQTVAAVLIYRILSPGNRLFRFVTAVAMFVFGGIAALVVRSLLLVLLAEAAVIVGYYVGRDRLGGTTPQ